MRKYIRAIFLSYCFTSLGIYAQVGMIGNNPNKNAILDLNKTNGTNDKGLLLPKVTLTSTTAASPMSAHVAGMHVYNTATAGTGVAAVTPGEYYNDGSKWIRLITDLEPWFNSSTKTSATSNTQNIYQMGKVGIGINSPAAPLHIDGKQTLGILVNYTNAAFTGNIWDGTASADGVDISNNSVRIQKGSGGSGTPLMLSKGKGYTSANMTEYYVAGNRVGSVVTTGTSVVYNTTSDSRLKENIKPTHYGLSDIMKIKVDDYNYKADEKKTLCTGFLAQELYKVYPQAVTVGGENEKTDPWQVDYSKLTPLLLKAIQDQQMQIEVLKNKIEILETKR
ncbi:tail fiber domain-containing protein [Flavobacterium panacagri]|uniref:tail fiber domain-containing protein n=1 Tax=Flavobacterium panacagri TaxID=3034146 RepID=UPI0025A616DA|nr:tail fiber domain-containing protein [Flavobacterium panacagri]